MSENEFNPDVELENLKEELNDLIDTTDGKDKEMYQEILELANGLDKKYPQETMT